jgi:3-dehydroquinate dehydratase
MSTLDEQWLQDIAESMGLPALSPSIVKMILPVVEVHIKKIAQQAHKFQRRSKANSLTGSQSTGLTSAY